MSEKKRVFIAMPLPDEVRGFLNRIVQRLKKGCLRNVVKWVERANFHQTLVFLGYKTDSEIKDVISVFETIEIKEPLFLSLKKLEFYPDLRRAQIIRMALGKQEEKLTRYFHFLRQKFELSGYEFDTRFSPHITLGRVRNVRGKRLFSDEVITEVQDFLKEEDVCFILDKVVLYESFLTSTGSTYNPLYTIDL